MSEQLLADSKFQLSITLFENFDIIRSFAHAAGFAAWSWSWSWSWKISEVLVLVLVLKQKSWSWSWS